MWTAPSLQGVLQRFDQIACARMSGLFARSHRNAGQDGFRDESSKRMSDLIEGHRRMRYFSHRGSIDHTICSSCKFWHRLSTVAVELLPVCGRPPPCKVFCSALIRSLAPVCPAYLRARTGTLAKMVSAMRVPNG